MRKLARNLIEKFVHAFGYELRAIGSPPCGYEPFLRYVSNIYGRPSTVFDVGVGNGTPWLYEAFPEAHFVLIEAQKDFEPALQDICRHIDAEYHLVGAGSAEAHRKIYCLPNSPTGSSFLRPNAETDRHYGQSTQSEETIHIVPLDTYAHLSGPFLVKIDTEGFELEVLRGASKILERTSVVLAEVALEERQTGEPDLIEIGSYMKSKGFRLIDFPTLAQQTLGGPLLYADVAFAKDPRISTEPSTI